MVNRFKIMDKEKEDRISLLPDCLLLGIISRLELSTKEVIKTTTTISKRWQHLWTLLPTLVFINKDVVTGFQGLRPYSTDLTNYLSFIDKTLTQCPTNVSLNKFKLQIRYISLANTRHTSQVNSWIRHAITRNVQEVELTICQNKWGDGFSYDDELFFNNSCLMSMKLSHCVFNPPKGVIRWDKLKCLCIDNGLLDEESIGKILLGSPCLETLELDFCSIARRFSKSSFGNFVVERLSCNMRIYEWFTNGDELFWDGDFKFTSMKLSRCVFNPPNGWVNLNFLCINGKELDEDLIEKILSGSPCLETLELNNCYGVRRQIDVASKSVKNLVLSNYRYLSRPGVNYINTIEINAPYILSLTIKETLYLEKNLLINASSLVKANLDYNLGSKHFAVKLGRTREDIEEELLRGLLTSLGHVNEITLNKNCSEAFSRLEAKGFLFREGSDRRINPDGDLVCFKQV